MSIKSAVKVGVLVVAGSILAACSSAPVWLPGTGPSRGKLEESTQPQADSPILLAEVDEARARKLQGLYRRGLFSEVEAGRAAPAFVVGAGDVLEVSIWEAPPAALFGSAGAPGAGLATSRANALPEQMVSEAGMIRVPFAGQVKVAGRSLSEIEAEIARLLKDKANQPQVLVRVLRNASANVTVVGEVAASQRVALTPGGERLLDALAAAGGVRQPVGKLTVQLTRGQSVQSLPLDTIIRDPLQNISLLPGDVITVLHQPLSFTVLGATGRNEELNFEAQGISLAQALARAGGVNDARADASGVFVFRFESPEAFAGEEGVKLQLTPEGRVPVIYRADLRNPATFLVAQNFPVRDKDVLYVSNASGAELQKFLNIVLSAAYPILNVINLTR